MHVLVFVLVFECDMVRAVRISLGVASVRCRVRAGGARATVGRVVLP